MVFYKTLLNTDRAMSVAFNSLAAGDGETEFVSGVLVGVTVSCREVLTVVAKNIFYKEYLRSVL